MSTATDTTKIPTRSAVRAAGTTERAPSIAITLRTDPKDEAKQIWIQIAKPGTFRGHGAGHFELSAKVFSEIVANFNAQTNKLIPVDFEHASEAPAHQGSIPHRGAPAQGWVTALETRADGNLWGLVTWGEIASGYIKAGQYKFLSPAIVFGAKDRVTGKPCGARLSSVALTNNPFLDGMQPVVAKRTEASEPAPKETGEAARSPDVDIEQEDPAILALTTNDEHGVPRWQSALITLQEDADAATLRATEAETALEAANAKIAEYEEQEIVAMVDGAISVWGERRGLSLSDRPALLEHARMNRANFSALYPPHRAGTQAREHHGRLVAAGAHLVAPVTLHEQATAMSTRDAAPEIPSHEAIATRFVEEAKAKGITMSREEGFSRAFTERQTLVAAARRAT